MTSHELDHLLANWAIAHRLADGDAMDIRANVLATSTSADSVFDADWLWSLLRPVTALMDRASDERGSPLPYLQLA